MNCYILVPGLSEKYRSGGLLVARDLAKLLNAKIIATHEKHPDALGLEVIASATANSIFITTWGPLVTSHIQLIRSSAPGARIIYYAQSFGWNIKVPPKIPIVCVSRYVMSQWALRTQENFITYIPPPLNPIFHNENKKRDIDIFVHARKQNEYCLTKLLPRIQDAGYRVQMIDQWVSQNDLAEFFNRTKLFVYLTGTHKAGLFRRLPAEGFGLPALEALACGAIVGSNLLGGVTDFLTPGENCIKLQNGDLDFDLKQIKNVIVHFRVDADARERLMTDYRPENVAEKWRNLFDRLTTCSL